MNEHKGFTPGPHKLETVRTQVGVCHKIGPLGNSTKLHYACLYDDCYSSEPRDLQLLADAKLFADAPNLLAQLERVTAQRASLIEVLGAMTLAAQMEWRNPHPAWAKLIEAAKKTIAEVENEPASR